MKIMRVGIDLAKDLFQVHGVDRDERPVWRLKLRRADWMSQLPEKIEPGFEIGMGARIIRGRVITVKIQEQWRPKTPLLQQNLARGHQPNMT